MKPRKKAKYAEPQTKPKTKSKAKNKMQAKAKYKKKSRVQLSAKAQTVSRIDGVKEKIILAHVPVDKNPVVNDIVNLILRDVKPLKKLMKVMKELKEDFVNRKPVMEPSFYTFMKVQEEPENEYRSEVQQHEASSQEDRENETSQVQTAR